VLLPVALPIKLRVSFRTPFRTDKYLRNDNPVKIKTMMVFSNKENLRDFMAPPDLWYWQMQFVFLKDELAVAKNGKNQPALI